MKQTNFLFINEMSVCWIKKEGTMKIPSFFEFFSYYSLSLSTGGLF